jgi:hypothetical protein
VWLEGRARKAPSRLAREAGHYPLWQRYSFGAHIDARWVPAGHEVDTPDGALMALPLSSARETATANRLLVETAVLIRVQACLFSWAVLALDTGEGSEVRAIMEPLERELDDLVPKWYGRKLANRPVR